MGKRNNCIVKYYTKDNEHIQTYQLEENSDYLLEGLIANGGVAFNPSKYGKFSDEERELMKIYFDPQSMTVEEGLATAQPNIQDPKKLKPIWVKIMTQLIKSFQDKIKEDRTSILSEIAALRTNISISNNSKPGLFGKKQEIKLSRPKAKLSDQELNKLFFDYRWSLVAISNIIACLNLAFKFDYLVEITAAEG